MLIIGLTGGIGSGKSTAARCFAELGVPIIDADEVAREAVLPGSEGLRELTEHFGGDMLNADGTLDRARLRKLIFSDPTQRHALEDILHPRIYTDMRRRIAELSAPYCLAVLPLLVETGEYHFVDRILVVDVAEEVQRARAQARDGASAETIDAMMQAQTSRDTRLAAADDIIDNSADQAHLRQQISTLHRRYLALAGKAAGQ